MAPLTAGETIFMDRQRAEFRSLYPSRTGPSTSHLCVEARWVCRLLGLNKDSGEADDKAGPFTQVSTGFFYTCALKLDGSVDCWGLNDYGQAEGFEPGPFTRSRASFTPVRERPDGSVDCWGGNTDWGGG